VQSSTSASPADKKNDETEVPSTEAKEESEVPSEEKTETDEGKETKSDLPPFHEHPRWKEVIKERDEVKTKLAELEAPAKLGSDISQYCAKNNISVEDLNTALELSALAKTDVRALRDRLNTYIETIDIGLGSKLPADLQKKLDDGVIDAETAKELSARRSQVNVTQQQLSSNQQQTEAQMHQQMVSTLNTWEQNKMQADPDYVKIKDMLVDRLTTLNTQNVPRTVSAAIANAEKAYADVKSRLNVLVPKLPERKVLRSNGASPNFKQPIKSLDDWGDFSSLVQSVAAKHR
jgi:hypothetical protein